jgi:hypothetical protein
MPEFNAKFNRETLTMAEVEALPAFRNLNEQQQNFVRHWVNSGGDQFFAFQNSYSSPDIETARKGSYSVVQRKSIREVLDAFLCKSEKEKFIEELERACRSPKITPTRLKLFELRAVAEFGIDLKSLRKQVKSKSDEKPETPDSPVEPPALDRNAKYKVGDRATYQNRAIVITAVEPETNRATDYEWLGDPQSPYW